MVPVLNFSAWISRPCPIGLLMAPPTLHSSVLETTSFPVRNLSCLCSATIFSSTSTPICYAFPLGICSTYLRLVRNWKIIQSSLIVFRSDPEIFIDLPNASESQSQDLNPDVLTMRQLSLGFLHFSSHPKNNYLQPQKAVKQGRGRRRGNAKQQHSRMLSNYFKGLLGRDRVSAGQAASCFLKKSKKSLESNIIKHLGFEFIQHFSSLKLKSPSRHYLILLPETPAENGCKYHIHFADRKTKPQMLQGIVLELGQVKISFCRTRAKA